MKAIMCRRYGPPDVLQLEEVEKPSPTEDRVLVKVVAASVNPADWHSMKGGIARLFGGLRKPKDPRMGTDIAGRVEAVGSKVTRFKPGDEVFGASPGGFAEYASAREDQLGLKPPNRSFEEAASVPIAGTTAFRVFGTKDRSSPGRRS